MAVPDTTTFALSDVINEITPSLHSLQGCFNDAIGQLFDGRYVGNRDRLSNFRNYGNPYLAITYADFTAHKGIVYRGSASDFRPNAHINEFQMKGINNMVSGDEIEAVSFVLVNTCTFPLHSLINWGADNIKFPSTISNNPTNVLWSDDGGSTYTRDYRTLAEYLDDPGNYYMEVGLNTYITHDKGCTGGISGDYIFPVQCKRYIEFDLYSVTKEKGSQTTSFHKWNAEAVEHIEDTGITVTAFLGSSSGDEVDLSIHDNGDTEEVLTCTVRTTATLLQEQKVFTVYHRGLSENYLSCIDITPNTTLGDSDNTHAWVVKNNSTQMSYSGILYWQVTQGDSESTATVIATGNTPITDLSSGGTVNKSNTWHCNKSDGSHAYFYASFNTAATWSLIETQLVST